MIKRKVETVQEDLLNIKNQLLNSGAPQTGNVDLTAIQAAIEKTEQGLKDHSEHVLQSLNNRVQTLPSLEDQAVGNFGSSFGDSTWNHVNSHGLDSKPQGVAHLKSKPQPPVNADKYNFTPAEKLKLKMVQRALYNPQNEQTREKMSENYGIQLPLIQEQRPLRTGMTNQKLILGTTVEPLAALPAANRKDPQLAPPPITDQDAQYGIISLLERGLIPPGADLTLNPSPVKNKLANIYPGEDKKQPVAIADGSSYSLAHVKLDTSIPGGSPPQNMEDSIKDIASRSPTSPLRGNLKPPKQKSIHMPKTIVAQKTLELQLHPVEHRNLKRPPPAIDHKEEKSIYRTVLQAVGRISKWDSLSISTEPSAYLITTHQRDSLEMAEHGTTVSESHFDHIYSLPKLMRSGASSRSREVVLPIPNNINANFGDTSSSQPPPTTPNIFTENRSIKHRFPIQHGRLRDVSPEYMAFRQHYCLSWGPIVTILEKMERLMQNYNVPVAFIDGDRLADLAVEFELERQPQVADLLMAVANREDVEQIINTPGQRFRGKDGENHAATRIQSQFRMFVRRRSYLEYRHRKWAAGVIALTWVMNVKMATMKRQLRVTRQRELANFKERTKEFAGSWQRIKRSRRVIIHVPSLGYAQRVRDTLNEFGTIQNTQMARLCDIRDPNVDVIYVSPVPINNECAQYYSKLLALKPAVDSGNVDAQSDLSDRYKMVIPEAIKSFPTHRMCLATHLKYSPKALKRIRALINGRDAYIVTGMPHLDDLSVAEFLNVPILGPEPEVAHLYSTKSGSKRIFQSASVKIPPGEFDIYTFPQLHDSLAQLITDNLDVRTWLFKMDHEFDGRGTAYCHIADHLRCYMWARKECERYTDKWSKKWAQEPVFNKIHSELPTILENHCIPLNSKVYKSWETFLNAFLARGGVVEATPPSDSVTALTVDMLIEPDGVISIQSSGDQIHAETPYRTWGLSVPQCSVEPEMLNDACMRIGRACKSRGILGYFSVDCITFINPKSGEQELWATDLNLQYDDSASMMTLAKFMCNGTFRHKEHMFDIPPVVMEKKRRRRRQANEEDEELPPTTSRYVVFSTRLLHSNLTVVHYSVFFQMCRAHGIGYDVKEKQGTVFTLIDSFNRENLGMLSIGDNLQGSLATFARNMTCIHQEISAPNMQGNTNFKKAVDDIEAILGTTIQNANDQEELEKE